MPKITGKYFSTTLLNNLALYWVAIDTFMSPVATTRKLGISFFEYVRDRITRTENIESLAQIIQNKTAPNLFG